MGGIALLASLGLVSNIFRHSFRNISCILQRNNCLLLLRCVLFWTYTYNYLMEHIILFLELYLKWEIFFTKATTVCPKSIVHLCRVSKPWTRIFGYTVYNCRCPYWRQDEACSTCSGHIWKIIKAADLDERACKLNSYSLWNRDKLYIKQRILGKSDNRDK